MAKTRIRVTTVEELTVENGAVASFIIDLVNKEQTTFSEGGWSLSEAGSTYSIKHTAEEAPKDG